MTSKAYKNLPQKQCQLSLFDWAARQAGASRYPAVRHVLRLGVRSPSLALTIAELAGLNVGADHD